MRRLGSTLPYLLLLMLAFALAEGQGVKATAEFRATAVVAGRVELLNSKVKLRDGRPNAAGVVIWLKPANGAASTGARQRQHWSNR